MESGWTQDLLNWITANPGWSGFLIFLISFVESLILVGMLIPGIFILFGVGTLVGLGIAEFMPIWIGGSLGAYLGDIFSFHIGHKYGKHLWDIWPFNRYPRLLERGTGFFQRHGAKSVMVGRFIGPLRPVIPATAGIMGMSFRKFNAVCIPACILWSPAYLIPGMLFGATLEVAAEYAGRLTLVLVVVVAVVWLTLWGIGALYALFAAYSARWMRKAIRWSRRHPVMGRIAGPIIDPNQPEVLSVTMLGLIVVLTLCTLLLLLFLSPFASQPEAIDLAVLDWARSLRNHIADPFMVAIAQMSRLWVLIPTAVAALLWLLGAQRYKAAIHWVVAIAGGLLLQLLMSWTLRSMPPIYDVGSEQVYVPSAPVTLTTVVLGFFAVMVARELRRRHRKWPYLGTAVLIALLLMARVYLGLDWLSGALVGCILGLAWTAIVGIAYRQRALNPFSGSVAISIFYGTLMLTTAWQVNLRLQQDLDALKLPLPEHSQAMEAWWEGGWSKLPTDRTRSKSLAARRFNLQVALPPNLLGEELSQEGWTPAEQAGWEWVVQALNPEPDAANLPLIGKDYLGHREVLALRRPSESPVRQEVIRLWDSGTRLQPGGEILYLGQISQEVLHQRLRAISYWRAEPAPAGALERIKTNLPSWDGRMARDDLLLIRLPRQPGSAALPPTTGPVSATDH